jgi:hypothetical protein
MWKKQYGCQEEECGLWGRFPEVKLSTLEVSEYVWRHECAPMSLPTLQAIEERASTGTTRVEAFSVEFPQLVVCKKGSGTRNLKSHVVSKHRAVALALWPETPPPNQPRLNSAALFGG